MTEQTKTPRIAESPPVEGSGPRGAPIGLQGRRPKAPLVRVGCNDSEAVSHVTAVVLLVGLTAVGFGVAGYFLMSTVEPPSATFPVPDCPPEWGYNETTSPDSNDPCSLGASP